jgi:hypothetical protein
MFVLLPSRQPSNADTAAAATALFLLPLSTECLGDICAILASLFMHTAQQKKEKYWAVGEIH